MAPYPPLRAVHHNPVANERSSRRPFDDHLFERSIVLRGPYRRKHALGLVEHKFIAMPLTVAGGHGGCRRCFAAVNRRSDSQHYAAHFLYGTTRNKGIREI